MFVRKNPLIQLFPILILVVAGFFLINNNEAKAWLDPLVEPPGGNLAAPLNPSASPQTKLGPLTLGNKDDTANQYGLLKFVPGGFTAGSSCLATGGEGQLAYQSAGRQLFYCPSSTVWTAVGGDFFQLNTFPQTGWGYLKNIDVNHTYTLKGVSYGDDTGTKLYYAGVEGTAGNASSVSTSYRGIYGSDNDFSSAYAGVFKGQVKIIKGDNATRLTVGTGEEKVQLCLNGDCLWEWPGSGTGDSFWQDSGAQVFLTPYNSRLYAGSEVASTAKFFVRSGEKKNVVIGQAKADSPLTCGDGICQTWEGNKIDSLRVPPATVACSQDCPPVVTSVTATQHNTTITISWNVDEHITLGRAEYSPDLSYFFKTASTPAGGPGTITRTITGLGWDRLYNFRIYVKDDFKNEFISGNYTFTTNKCGDGSCEASEGENCATCFNDCKGIKGDPAGCLTNEWCCGDSFCTTVECRTCNTPLDCDIWPPKEPLPNGWACCDHLCRASSNPCCVDQDCPTYPNPYNMCYWAPDRNTCSQCTDGDSGTRSEDCVAKLGSSYHHCCLGPGGVKYCGECCRDADCPAYKPDCCFVGHYLKCQQAGSCGSGGGGCFLPDTKILMADNTQKPIKEVKNGDLIYGYQDGQLRPVKVTQTFRHPDTSKYYVLSLANGQRLKVTGIHPIFNGQEYVNVENLKIGDTVYIHDNSVLTPTKIKNIIRIDQSTEVYNLEVDQTNNYFAEGILVHNKTYPVGGPFDN